MAIVPTNTAASNAEEIIAVILTADVGADAERECDRTM